MKIILFTIDDTDFVPELIDPLVKKYGHQIEKVYVSKTFPNPLAMLKKNWLFFIKNFYPFCIHPLDLVKFFIGKLTSSFQKGGHKSIFHYLESKNLTYETVPSISTKSFRLKLESLNPDLCIFAAFDKIAGPKFLSIPKLGTINVHLGKLPSYRGALSAFWVLRFGDAEAGASIHLVTPEIDRGDLIEEVRLPVQTKSMHRLMQQTVSSTAPALLAAVEKMQKSVWTPIDISERKENYYYLPTLKDFLAFYAKGNRLI